MTPEQLKASILQHAMQGKLTERSEDGGSALDLLNMLKASKAELVKSKTIKKEKALSEISEDDIPFDIPDEWEWCRIQDIFFAHSAMRIHQSDWKAEGIPFFRGRELVRLAKTGDPNAEVFITEEFYNELKEKGGVPQKDDILITAVGTLGKVYVVQGTKKFYYKDAYILCLDNYGVDPYYIKYLIESPHYQNYIYGDDAYGTTVAQLTLEKLKRMIIPLPSLEEQHRIVAKIDEILPYVDCYAEAYEKLEQFNVKFPEEMKKSILQYAIQGKLVEQRPEEGTAEDLYKQLQEEKAQLVNKGEIKAEKPLPKISEEEIPFDIPDSWKWVRWGDISFRIQYGYNAPAQKAGRIKMVRISDIQDDKVLWEAVPYCDIPEDEIADYLLKDNDILFARTGGTVGKSFLVEEVPEESIYAGYLIRTSYSSKLCPKYLKYFMGTKLYWDQLRNGTIATAQPNCNGKTLSKMILPLPPYEEQCRIVEKIDAALPYCERLITS